MADSPPDPPDTLATRWRWALPAALFLVVTILYANTAAFSVISLDVRSANIASWRIAESGTPWIEGLDLPVLDNDQRATWVIEPAANGHSVIGRSPGTVIAGLPAYWIFGSTTFSMAPGALTAALLAAVSVLLMALALRQLITTIEACVGAAVFGLTTPMWSVAANGIWPHTITTLGIAGMAWAAATRRWWLVGLFGGVVLWGRLHAAVIVAVVGLYVAWRRREPAIAVRIGLMGGLALALICVWSRWMYGTWSPTASYDTTVFEDYARGHKLDVLNQLWMWVSPEHGILVWTPVILLLVPGLVRGWNNIPDWARGLVFGGVAYTVLQAALNIFRGGSGYYGYRLTLELLACATPALVLAAREVRPPWRALIGPVLGVQLAAFLVGSTTDIFAADWDNAFVLALRTYPAVLIPLTVLMALAGTEAQRRLTAHLRPVARDDSRGTVSSHSVP